MSASASNPTGIICAADPEALARTYADWLVARLQQTTGPFRLALCGGASPRPLYRLLGSDAFRRQIDWSRLEIFWGDERFVPHDAAESNFREANELWLRHVPIPPPQVIPFPTVGSIEDCARTYELILRAHYGKAQLDPDTALFDVVLLGIGENGHTASLMPGSSALEERQRWAVPMLLPVPQARLTLTYPALASSKVITFLAWGEKKAEVVARVRSKDETLPAARVRSEGDVLWFLDRGAAGEHAEQREDDRKD